MTLFLILLAAAFLLIATGLFLLIYAIPRWTPKGDLRTELLSARAALWCVGVGLTIALIAALGETIKAVLLHKP